MERVWLLAWTLFVSLFPTWFYVGLWFLVSPHTQMGYAVMALTACSLLMVQIPRLRTWYWRSCTSGGTHER